SPEADDDTHSLDHHSEGSVDSDEQTEEGDGAGNVSPDPQPTPPTPFQRAKAFALKWHLPILLVLALVLGVAVPRPAQAANDTPLSFACVVIIFFISGLKLKTDDLLAALAEVKAWVFGLATILLLTPTVGFALAALPLQKDEFSLGLALFAAMPTTISSCIVLTGGAKGNVALALFLSVATNLASIASVPLWLSAILTSVGTVRLDVVALLLKLVYTILLPLLAGRAAQLLPGVPRLVAQHKNTLKVASSLFLALIPWTKAGSAASDLLATSAGAIFTMLALGVLLHFVYLALNTAATQALGLPWSERAAVLLAGSQKTLSVAVAVIDAAPAALGNPGLLLLPCILAHFTQIVIDAVLFSVLRSRMAAGGGADEAKDAAGEEDSVETESGPIVDAGVDVELGRVETDGTGSAESGDGASDAASTLHAATAVNSTAFREILTAASAERHDTHQPQSSAAPAAADASFSTDVATAAAATGHEHLGDVLVQDLLRDDPLTEDAVPSKAPRVGPQFQVAELPQAAKPPTPPSP
ncbi:BASS4, partial [Symbiodinium sp. KB8]